jgi:antitoxin MazE
MQVAKWGNSLAVRLPTTVVEALDLKEGDQIEITIVGEREFEVTRDQTKKKALARLRRPLPAGFSLAATKRMSDKAFLTRTFSCTSSVRKTNARQRPTRSSPKAASSVSRCSTSSRRVSRRKLGMSWVEIGDALAAIRVLCPSPVR